MSPATRHVIARINELHGVAPHLLEILAKVAFVDGLSRANEDWRGDLGVHLEDLRWIEDSLTKK